MVLRHALIVIAATGCNALLSLDGYRPCQATECDASAADVADVAPPMACKMATDCGPPNVACSNNQCASVATLVQGTSNGQCVILSDHTLWCWGKNDHGQLGRGLAGGEYPNPAPVAPSVLAPTNLVQQAAMGNDYGCALTMTGDVWCWGNGTAGGGNPTGVKVALPMQATALSGGSEDACAILSDKSVVCWGNNGTGNDGCDADAGMPNPVKPSSPHILADSSYSIDQVATGLDGTCARSGSKVYCFGDAAWGILGDGTPQQLGNPCHRSTVSNENWNGLDSLTNSDFAACIGDVDAQYWCWGVNYVYFGIGLIWPFNNAMVFTTPFPMPFKNNTTAQISIGWEHACALDQSGTVECWGWSEYGETGLIAGSPTNPITVYPGPVNNLPAPAASIAAQRQFTCALLQDGSVACWGSNQFENIAPKSMGVAIPTPTRIAF